MKRRKQELASVLAIAFGWLVAGPAGAAGPVLTLEKTLPPKYPDILEARDVAVLSFTGTDGDELTALLEGVVAAALLDGKPVFRVGDRTTVTARYQEIERSQSGKVKHAKGTVMLKDIGVDAIYTGSVERPNVEQNNARTTKRVCVERDKRNNAAALLGLNCKAWADQVVNCQKRTATYAFNARLTMVADGRVLMSRRFDYVLPADSCANEQVAQLSNEHLLEGARQGAISQFRQAISYTEMKLKVEMFPADSKIPNKAMRVSYADGLAFAKEKRMDRACVIWERATSVSEAPLPLLFALGVCKESDGDMAGAHALYTQADQMLSRPDKKVSAALERTEGQGSPAIQRSTL